MARKRFTPEQIVKILRDTEKIGVKDACKKHNVCDQTIYRWKRMYGGVGVSEVQRIKQLEKENKRLKELCGNQALALDIIQEQIKKKGLM
ncbi:MAG: hypothetical protein COB59_12475 [Rhodospirillaceae bacterium]|nr:MAG: hypothetical protein COB59_12475 [Rhodospirillaceae bacterium]